MIPLSYDLKDVKEYNRKRDMKKYLIGIQENLGPDVKLSELITKIDMELIVLEKKFSNDTTEQ